MADGSIEFSTRLDNSDLEKQLKEAEKSINSLKRKIETASTNKSFIEKQMDRAQKSIEAASAETERLRAKLEQLKNVDSTDASAYFAAQGQIESYTTRLAEAEKHEAQLAEQKYRLDEKWQAAGDKVDVYKERLAAVTARHARLSEEAKAAAEKSAASYNSAGERIRAKFSSIADSMRTRLSNAATSAAKPWQDFGSKVGTMLRRVFIFGAILQGLRKVRDAISAALMENERYAVAMQGLKAAMSGFAAGIAQIIGPAVTSAVNMATSALMNLAALVDSVFNTHISQAIAQSMAAAEAAYQQGDATEQQADASQDAADYSDDAANAVGDQAAAANDLADAEERAAKSIMGFDELNVLQAENARDAADALGDESGSVGGGGRGGNAAPTITPISSVPKPDWDAFDVGKISQKLAEIMVIIGAALMAVGAILCFSGINIPLGITLMAVGALLIYTAYKEQWDKLPQEVRNAITAALVLTGIALVVIGAVLAFSGINIPLGIGLMAAGLVMLYTAAALNWGTMPEQMKMAITTLMLILGTALLVIGAILTLTGANVPLGLGLMALGALSLVAAAVINWEWVKENMSATIVIIETLLGSALLVIGAILTFSGANLPLGIALMAAGAILLIKALVLDWDKLPGNVQSVIVTIEAILAPALLVIGAILAFTGVNLPLGIALLAAGALMLVHLEKLNWDKIPQETRNFVSTMLGIVGTALLVLGIILCATGVGVPIGIALIAAGATSMIAAVAVNWGYLQQKIQEVWNGIVQWWHNGPARIFTAEWWANLFKSIVNGLISAINAGLSAFGGFINWIGSGVNSILAGFGIQGGGWTVGIPKIPYLAEGAVIPPNRKFMAVLGDQTSGNNIETPESLMRQVVREEAGQLVADAILALTTQQGSASGDAVMVLNVDGETLARAVNRGNASLLRRGEIGTSISFA